MALSEDEKLEVKKLIRSELMSAATEIANEFQGHRFDTEVKDNAWRIYQIIQKVLSDRHSMIHNN